MSPVNHRRRSQTAEELIKTGQRSLVAFAFIALSACASVPSLAIPVDALPNHELRFENVRVMQTKQGLRVSGIVRRSTANSGALWGHIHIAALLPQGSPVTVDTRWSGNLSGRNYRSAPFSAIVPGLKPDQVRSVVITYRILSDVPK